MQNYEINAIRIHEIMEMWKHKEIALPETAEFQRPFTWTTEQVCDLFDSLLKGLSIGCITIWENIFILPGSTNVPDRGQKLLIDGQQRLTALFFGYGIKAPTDTKQIKIAFNPTTKEFREQDSEIAHNKNWIPDISTIISNTSDNVNIDLYDIIRCQIPIIKMESHVSINDIRTFINRTRITHNKE
jgi:uncharacterized protein with ParB-like and HNH nuclease domain